MTSAEQRRRAIVLAAVTAATLVVFALWPELDLRVSAWFHDPAQGFWLGRVAALDWVRHRIWDLSLVALALSLAGVALGAFGQRMLGLGWRGWGFVASLYLLGPGLLVNGVLKEYWGRARPANVVDFGGTAQFTPPWLPTDQCTSNCSFVSGEGSAAMALMITGLMIAPYLRARLPCAALAGYLAIAVAIPLLGMGLRVATGRHFLSDTVFAGLLVLTLALVLYRVLRLPDRADRG